MGLITRSLLGAGVGAGVGYVNSARGREEKDAAAGAMIGALGFGASVPLARGAWGIGRAGARGAARIPGRMRSGISQARGRYAWRGNFQQFGPIRQVTPSRITLMANKAMNSFRDAVGTARAGFGGMMRDAKIGMSMLGSKVGKSGFLQSARMSPFTQEGAARGIASKAWSTQMDNISSRFVG